MQCQLRHITSINPCQGRGGVKELSTGKIWYRYWLDNLMRRGRCIPVFKNITSSAHEITNSLAINSSLFIISFCTFYIPSIFSQLLFLILWSNDVSTQMALQTYTLTPFLGRGIQTNCSSVFLRCFYLEIMQEKYAKQRLLYAFFSFCSIWFDSRRS